MNRQSGYAVVWGLIVCSFLVVGAVAVALFFDDEPASPELIGIGAAGLALLIACTVIECKRDVYNFYVQGMLCGGLLAVALGIAFFVGFAELPVLIAMLVFALFALFCGLKWARAQYGKEALPDILRQQYQNNQVREADDVQFVPSVSTKFVRPHDSMDFYLTLQNSMENIGIFMLNRKIF